MDLLAAINGIDEVKNTFIKLRQDTLIFDHLIQEVNNFVNEKKEFEFSEFKTVRIRRIKIMPGEKSKDDAINDPLNKFKILF